MELSKVESADIGSGGDLTPHKREMGETSLSPSNSAPTKRNAASANDLDRELQSTVQADSEPRTVNSLSHLLKMLSVLWDEEHADKGARKLWQYIKTITILAFSSLFLVLMYLNSQAQFQDINYRNKIALEITDQYASFFATHTCYEKGKLEQNCTRITGGLAYTDPLCLNKGILFPNLTMAEDLPK
ncbi:Uncharacterised protein [Candidatus Anstonella stagnisolia]|nr:Uncharacterised protein [Candidatus Anstonella stagnisolia]